MRVIRERTYETHEGIPGTPDLVIIWEREKVGLVRDSKYGYAAVEKAELNLQLRVYALCVWDNFDLREIYVAITQPKNPRSEWITLAKYTEGDIELAREHVNEIMAASAQENAPLHAGEWCRFCRAKLVCPEFRKLAQSGLVVFDGELPPELSKAAALARIEKRLAECSDEQLGAMHRSAALIQMIREPMNDEIRRRIEAGKMDGYSLGKEIEVRMIANVKRAISLLTLSKIATKDQLLEIAELSIGPIEEQYRKDTGCTWKEARDRVNKVLQAAMELEKRKPRIIPPTLSEKKTKSEPK
jgi:hypothetical protein